MATPALVETETPIPGDYLENPPSRPLHPSWLNAWIKANAFFPFSYIVIGPVVAEKVIGIQSLISQKVICRSVVSRPAALGNNVDHRAAIIAIFGCVIVAKHLYF